MNANAIAISGGSTKISFLAGVAIELMKKNDYQIITGISAGSIVSLLLAVKEYEVLEDAILNTTQNDYFKINPVTNKGRISLPAIWRFVKGCFNDDTHSLGVFKLDKLLKKYYTPEMHTRLQSSGKIVKIGTVNLNMVTVDYFDIVKLDYETAIKCVVASSSIPLATQTVDINSQYYVDGGMLEHVAGMEAIKSGASSLDVIFSRSKDMDLADPEWKPSNEFKVSSRLMDVILRYISVHNEKDIINECLDNNIPFNLYHTPYRLVFSNFKMDKETSKLWLELGKEIANKQN